MAHEIMVNPVYKVKDTDTVLTVIEKFVDHRISGMPVVNDRNEIVGFISDGDILRYIGKHRDIVFDFGFFSGYVLGDKDPFDVRPKQLQGLNVMLIAKTKVIKVKWDTDIEVVAGILGERKIKKVPVERNGVLAGIISRGDVIRHVYKAYLS